MNEQLKKFYKDNAQVKSVSLSAETKAKVKTAIFANLKNEPQIVESVSWLENLKNLFTKSYVVIPLALILLVGGTTIVSADSIPGDILYPVKRKMEDVRLYVAPTSESRSELEIEFSKKRIEESEKLRSRQMETNSVDTKNVPEDENSNNEDKDDKNDTSSVRTKEDKKNRPMDRVRQIQISADKDAKEALEKLEKFQRKFQEEKREQRSEKLKLEIEHYKKQQELIKEQRKEALQEDQEKESEEDNSNQD